jgi:hypothetical protein
MDCVMQNHRLSTTLALVMTLGTSCDSNSANGVGTASGGRDGDGPQTGGEAPGTLARDGGGLPDGSGTEDPGTEDPGTEDSGTELPGVPCLLEECPGEVFQGERPEPGPSPVCPADTPTLGDTCELDRGVQCGFGDSVTALCREIFECADNGWVIPKDREATTCPHHEDNYCPDVPHDGETCTIGSGGAALPCDYPSRNTRCICSVIPGQVEGIWGCYGPPQDTRCPAALPNLGQSCAVPSVQCSYVLDPCSATPYNTVFCFDGIWEGGTPQGLCAL